MSNEEKEHREEEKLIKEIGEAPLRYSHMINVCEVTAEQAMDFIKKVKKRFRNASAEDGDLESS
ncbi:MAG: hypothetical protein AB7L09_00925 [Nitrospira sp.]